MCNQLRRNELILDENYPALHFSFLKSNANLLPISYLIKQKGTDKYFYDFRGFSTTMYLFDSERRWNSR